MRYCCMDNIKKIISKHNLKILNEQDNNQKYQTQLQRYRKMPFEQ